MKAVILAGGRGERLRPITDTRPKPLVPVLARPVMDYCLSLLGHHGVTKAYVTTHYLASQIRHRYGEEAFGVQLSYHAEKEPLGTCGGVKELEEHLAGEECFLVMSGDALCDFDLSSAIRFHREKKADVTIILSSVKTPLEYGVVLQDTMEQREEKVCTLRIWGQ
jgi:mannose-1-phosphate guanylyltransferase/phosphomannomutase